MFPTQRESFSRIVPFTTKCAAARVNHTAFTRRSVSPVLPSAKAPREIRRTSLSRGNSSARGSAMSSGSAFILGLLLGWAPSLLAMFVLVYRNPEIFRAPPSARPVFLKSNS
jgi:hypothetical protein